MPRSAEEAAETLGATGWQVFRLVTLPLAAPGVLAGLALAWVRMIGEFGIVMIFAYFPQGMPVQLYINLQNDGVDSVYSLVWLLLAASLPLPLWILARRSRICRPAEPRQHATGPLRHSSRTPHRGGSMEYRYKGSLRALEHAAPVGEGDGVSLVQQRAGAPATAVWRPGVRVLDALRVWPGSAIATFADATAGYHHAPGQQAALFVAAGPPDAEGRPGYLIVIDQTPGGPLQARTIQRYTPQQARALRVADADNAEHYYLIR